MNNRLLTYVGLCVLLALTLVSGFVQGKLTNRWGRPADLTAAAEQFRQIPTEFGEWQLQKPEKMSDIVVDMLQCAGYINGSYVNRSTGEVVNAFVILGPPGPISVHTPEVCYSSKNYEISESRSRVKIGDPKTSQNELWAMTLRSNDVSADLLRVYYGWGNAGHWTAPESPRVTYGGDSLLFKIQLAAYLPPDTDLNQQDTCRRFLEAFLPVLNPAIFAISPAEKPVAE